MSASEITALISAEEIESSPKRLKFTCIKCGEYTEAPSDTNRVEKKLCRACFGKKEDRRKNQLNDLTGKEWTLMSKSVEEYPDTRSAKQRAHGASFPASLAERQILCYTKKGDTVFDPFAGVGTTLDVAQRLGRNGIGIELNQKFVEIAEEDLKNTTLNGTFQRMICDDILNMLNYLEPNSIDFELTSPPYATLLNGVKGNFAYKWREHSKLDMVKNPRPYSGDKRDLGNLTYSDFFKVIDKVFEDTYTVLKDDCYVVWVVKDYRDFKHGKPYVNFHSDVIQSAEKAGFVLWDIRIYDQTKFRPLVVLGYPSRNFYLNIGHSYLLVFKKHTRDKPWVGKHGN
jgi:DNA modification methylase